MMKKEKCCLLVEDDREDQDFFLDALHSVSSSTGCYTVSNGEEALVMLLQKDCAPDYIFTDLNMPRMDGLEFLRNLRAIEQFKSIPVIVYSSDYSEEQIRKAQALGAVAFYSKTRMDVLKEILRKYFPEHRNTFSIL
jgi:CheY-like chemotaxis protein